MAKKSEEIDTRKRKAAAPKAESARKSTPKTRKSRIKLEDPEAEVKSARAEVEPSTVKTKSARAKPRNAKPKAANKTEEPEAVAIRIGDSFEDPIGDVSDGEGRFYLTDSQDSALQPEMAAYRADTADDALEGTLESHLEESAIAREPAAGEPRGDELSGVKTEARNGTAPNGTWTPGTSSSPERAARAEAADPHKEPQPPAKLDRLQKILSRAGIASRRHAEEMIQAGRVMVNGQVITQLGAKADPARDHIRVDGKLISGAERRRYFVLNKPRGYVTTVSDPENRPTVMQFFSKIGERLYPVGRLDYDSEGLLLVTNDGELANQLTRAASGIEKTYLVKVAGRPTEDELEQLRSGVAIEREGPGSGKVHTAPAQIRQVRHGDNPWYEVVLTEGRNRELRKMFQSIGHFVEKIRRVAYGPLVLDLEPGKLRELSAEEVSLLHMAAEGKWKPRLPQAGFGLRGSKPRQPAERTRTTGRDKGRQEKFREHGSREPDRRGAARFGQRSFQRPDQRPDQGPAQGPAQSEKSFRNRTGWKQREERSSATRSGRPFRGRPEFDSRAGTRPEDHRTGSRSQSQPRESTIGNGPRRNWSRHSSGNFNESRRTEFSGEPSRKSNQPPGKDRNRERDEQWNRSGNRGGGNRSGDQRRGGKSPEHSVHGSFRPASGAKRENNRGGGSGPRGFTPGRFSKPGGNRSGFKGKPGRGNRGAPPSGGRKRG